MNGSTVPTLGTAGPYAPGLALALACGLIGVSIGLAPSALIGGPVLPLVVSAVALAVFALWAWWQEPRAIGGTLTAVALLCYFPLRGLLLTVVRPTAYDGVNWRVLERLGSRDAAMASLAVLVVTVAFLCGYLGARALRRRDGGSSGAERGEPRTALGSAALALLVVGCAALSLHATASLDILRVGSTEGGFLSQVRDGLALCAGLGVLVAPTTPLWPARALFRFLVFVAFVIAAVAGSKDVMAQLLVALLLRHVLLTPSAAPAGRGARRLWAVPAVLLLVLFAVFPALNSYRRSILHGETVVAAAQRVPSDLSRNTIVLGLPRQEKGPVAYGYDAVLFVTKRLHGYDSLLLGISRGRDPDVLTARGLVTSPLAVLLPTRLVDPHGQDVSQLFAQEYWGLRPGDTGQIAIGTFTQMWLAFGWPLVVAMGLLVGVMALAADELFAAGSIVRFMAGYAVLLGVLAMERDVVFVIAGTGRRLLVVLAVALLLQPLRERRHRPEESVAGAPVATR